MSEITLNNIHVARLSGEYEPVPFLVGPDNTPVPLTTVQLEKVTVLAIHALDASAGREAELRAEVERLKATGTWPQCDLRRAFVDGVAWWERQVTGATIWPEQRRFAEIAAERKYPEAAEAAKEKLC
ncbi:MAG: hypothetical protein V1755_06615 [Chloroflexota bacterium]